MDMDEIPTWSRNNTVLLGDACHPVLAFGFSGASMAIEDAVTLAEFLSSDIRPDEIPARLKLYEEVRRPRVGMVRDHARIFGRGGDSKETLEPYMKALATHDAVAFARGALAKHLEAKA